ncbi:response regulator [Anaeromyxobacter sp. Fw109-5]|uniref:response regulator n=1 Tax=Anaeromyxobacter sp. (strain Fw109-5) TaxID=404589 RepID=UPI000158A55E|nr:response regulator [Anaeromyxobacter sp. Fw109-5]ABS25035.1 response regulator receiver protein [Anaeromyxobacter sp. Fw109-5]
MATTHRSILLIEDDSGIRDTVAECLASEGYEVAPVENGREALSWLRNTSRRNTARPDLIMVDLVMPVMNGAQFIEELRGDASLRDIPIVLMTAASPSSAMPLPRADAYLAKPFDLGALLDTVERHCTAAA